MCHNGDMLEHLIHAVVLGTADAGTVYEVLADKKALQQVIVLGVDKLPGRNLQSGYRSPRERSKEPGDTGAAYKLLVDAVDTSRAAA